MHRIKLDFFSTVAFDHLCEHIGWNHIEALNDLLIVYDDFLIFF